MAIDEGLDTGPVYAVSRSPSGRRDGRRAAGPPGRAGPPTCSSTPGRPGSGPEPQVGGRPTPPRSKPRTCARLVIRRRQLHRVVRLGGPGRPGEGNRLLVLAGGSARARRRGSAGPARGRRGGDRRGGLQLLTVQPEGRAPMAAADWLRGARPAPGRAARVVSRAAPSRRGRRRGDRAADPAGLADAPAAGRGRPDGGRGGRPGQRRRPRAARRRPPRRPGPAPWSPSWSTAPAGCSGRVTGWPTATSGAGSTLRCGRRCGSGSTSWPGPASRPTRPCRPPSTWSRAPAARWSTPCCGGWRPSWPPGRSPGQTRPPS